VAGLARKKNKIKGKFLVLEDRLLVSDQWKSLSSKAVHAYILFRQKFNGKNADDISLTYREVSPYMSSRTFRKALEELLNKELITLVSPGGLYRGCSIYSIKNQWSHLGKTDKKFKA